MSCQDFSPAISPRGDYLGGYGFWDCVVFSDGCWIWKGRLDRHGYGKWYLNKRLRIAHRVAWEMAYGPIPDGLFACHHCDNPACVRPDHIFLGTALDNQRDRIMKGRPGAKTSLTNDEVRALRADHAARVPLKELERRYRIGHTQVWRIVARKQRKYVQ